MKLPIPFLLYVTAMGLLGFAGWTVYKMLPSLKQEARTQSSQLGMKEATDRISSGKGKGPVSVDWAYGGRASSWWETLKEVNLIGKLPPPPPDVVVSSGPKDPPKVVVRPLDEIIELISLVYDGETQGKGGKTQVIVRYKDPNVQPPEGVAAAAAATTAPMAAPVAPRDTTPQRGGRGAQPPRLTPLPTSQQGREIIQKIWAEENEAEGHIARLWPPFSDIKLVRVANDAGAAFFVRDVPPPEQGKEPAEAKEEELIKTNLGLDQAVLRAVRNVQGRAVKDNPSPGPSSSEAGGTEWQEHDDTTLVNGVRHIGRKDEERFGNPDELFRQVSTGTYVSKSSKISGVEVRSVTADVASRFGVAQGDVLIEVNNREVRSQTQALELGKADWNRGVRTFVTKWLSNGQIVERVYQGRDR